MTEAEATRRHRGIDERALALARIAAAIASDVDRATLQSLVCDGLSAGASEADIVAVLFETAPLVGSVRLVACAPDVALAVGYDVDDVFEHLDDCAAVGKSSRATPCAERQANLVGQEKP